MKKLRVRLEKLCSNGGAPPEKGGIVGSPAVGMLLVTRWLRRDMPHESGSHIPP